MSFMMAFGPCWACGRPFGFNPEKVPSVRDPETGEKEPVCQRCMDAANVERGKRGIPELEIHPNAYGPEEVPEVVLQEGT